MNLEILSTLVNVIAIFLAAGYYLGKIYSRLTVIEKNTDNALDEIGDIKDALLNHNILKISDFRKKSI